MTIYHYIQASIDHAERCEDAFMIFPGNGKAPVYSAIDGMGGHQRQADDGSMITGREASQMVRSVLIEDLAHLPADVNASPKGEAETKVIAALTRAHRSIRLELNEFSRISSDALAVVITPANVDPNVTALSPS